MADGHEYKLQENVKEIPETSKSIDYIACFCTFDSVAVCNQVNRTLWPHWVVGLCGKHSLILQNSVGRFVYKLCQAELGFKWNLPSREHSGKPKKGGYNTSEGRSLGDYSQHLAPVKKQEKESRCASSSAPPSRIAALLIVVCSTRARVGSFRISRRSAKLLEGGTWRGF